MAILADELGPRSVEKLRVANSFADVDTLTSTVERSGESNDLAAFEGRKRRRLPHRRQYRLATPSMSPQISGTANIAQRASACRAILAESRASGFTCRSWLISGTGGHHRSQCTRLDSPIRIRGRIHGRVDLLSGDRRDESPFGFVTGSTGPFRARRSRRPRSPRAPTACGPAVRCMRRHGPLLTLAETAAPAPNCRCRVALPLPSGARASAGETADTVKPKNPHPPRALCGPGSAVPVAPGCSSRPASSRDARGEHRWKPHTAYKPLAASSSDSRESAGPGAIWSTRSDPIILLSTPVRVAEWQTR
jgi:hypothetical protein